MIGAELFRAAACILKRTDKPFSNIIRVEFQENHPRIIATDGAAMIVIRFQDAGNVADLNVDKDALLASCVREEMSRAKLILCRANTQDYPQWRRVLPHYLSGETGQFDPEYLQRFENASDELGPRSGISITHNGARGAALINFTHPDAFGILMPIAKSPEPARSVPEWGFL